MNKKAKRLDDRCKSCANKLVVWRRKVKKDYEHLDTGVCDCCGEKKDYTLHFDHCHETGKYRGFLCARCNQGIGYFNDSSEGLRKAVEYLERFEKQWKK